MLNIFYDIHFGQKKPFKGSKSFKNALLAIFPIYHNKIPLHLPFYKNVVLYPSWPNIEGPNQSFSEALDPYPDN